MDKFLVSLTLILFFVLTSPTLLFAGMCRYIQAVSGDTIIVDCRGEQLIIRLYGIDSPDIGMIHHDHAQKFIDDLMHKQQTHIVVQGVSKQYTDQYGRHVALIYKDGICVNQQMIKAGWAFLYQNECKLDICNEWKNDEQEAKNSNLGVWVIAGEDKPWMFRKKVAHLSQKNMGFFEDIYYYRVKDPNTNRQIVVATDTELPKPKFYAPPEPEPSPESTWSSYYYYQYRSWSTTTYY